MIRNKELMKIQMCCVWREVFFLLLLFLCRQLWPGIPSMKVCLPAEVLMALCSSGTPGNNDKPEQMLWMCWPATGLTGSDVYCCALCQGGEGGWRDGDGSWRDDLESGLASAGSHPVLRLQRPHQVRTQPPYNIYTHTHINIYIYSC